MLPTVRNERMARIRSKDTRPEMTVRRAVWASGFRYRLHGRGLPGKPDLVFAGRRKIIFVHGCFWHHHPGCPKAQLPRTRRDFWLPKLAATRRRDARNTARLRAAGWSVMVVWECQLKDAARLRRRLLRHLLAPTAPPGVDALPVPAHRAGRAATWRRVAVVSAS